MIITENAPHVPHALGRGPIDSDRLVAAIDGCDLSDKAKEILRWLVATAEHHFVFHTNDDWACLNGTVWHLVPGVERNKEHPDTFSIPSDAMKEAVGPGTLVKLMFEIDQGNLYRRHVGGERMWVEVTAVEPDGTFVGRLDCDPAVVECLLHGEEIVFSRDHIIDIDTHTATHDRQMSSSDAVPPEPTRLVHEHCN